MNQTWNYDTDGKTAMKRAVKMGRRAWLLWSTWKYIFSYSVVFFLLGLFGNPLDNKPYDSFSHTSNVIFFGSVGIILGVTNIANQWHTYYKSVAKHYSKPMYTKIVITDDYLSLESEFQYTRFAWKGISIASATKDYLLLSINSNQVALYRNDTNDEATQLIEKVVKNPPVDQSQFELDFSI